MEAFHAGKTRISLLPALVCAAALLFSCGYGRGLAMAGTVNGFMEYNYSGLTTRTQTGPLETSSSRVDSFTQRYSLSLLADLFPMLRLNAGGLYEQQFYWTSLSGPGRNSRLTTWQPSIDLTLMNPVYTAGIGYNRREETLDASGLPSATQVNEDYHLLLGWRPAGLPALDLQLSRNNRFDPLRILQDNTTDRAAASARYLPVKDLDLRYQFVYSDSTDNLLRQEVKETTNTARASYSGQFFDRRVSVFTNYNLSVQNISFSAAGNGFVDLQLFPAFGLSAATDLPVTGALAQNSQLIDGSTTASSGVGIGVTPPPGDVRRNIGVDFFSETLINHILVWVDRELPPAIASSFAWDIYTSSDNTTWTLWRSLASAPFGPFQNSFNLLFDPVKTRYIKVVTRPLSPVAAAQVPTFKDPDRIFITELQTFFRQAAASTRGDTTTTSQMYSLDVKARILDSPSLYYNGSFYMTIGGVPSSLRYTLSNGLSLNHPLTDYLTVTGRVAREDIDEAAGHTVGYVYDASLRATPLKTVTNTLLYSGRVDFKPAGTASSNSLYLFNTAEIYRGINLNLGGGASLATSERGVDTNGTSLLFGLSIVPATTLTTNLSYTMNRSSQSGAGQPQSSLTTQRGEISAAWRPFTTLYLYGALGFLDQTGRKTDLTQNYGLNWSPFPDGTLQFNFAFNQNMQTQNSARTTLITPSLTWQITARIVLDSSVSFIETDSNQGTTKAQVVSSNLRINF